MRLLALHFNEDNELICCLREQDPPLLLHDFSVTQVVVFGRDYKRKITFEFDVKGNRLFTHPARIRTHSENLMCIVDWEESNRTGKIVALDRSGRLKFSYCGPTYFKFFKPISVVVTQSDIIVLSDQHNDALLALDSSGHLLAIQYVHELGITTPCALCIDSEGFLLIGCYEDEGRSGKIHAVKMTQSLMWCIFINKTAGKKRQLKIQQLKTDKKKRGKLWCSRKVGSCCSKYDVLLKKVEIR